MHSPWMTEIGFAPPDFPDLDEGDLECDCDCPTCAHTPVEWRIRFVCGCGALLCDPCGTVAFHRAMRGQAFPLGLSCVHCGQFTPGPVTFAEMINVLERLTQ